MTLREYIDTIKNKKVAVIGIGVSNTPLIDRLLAEGVSVTACDKRTREQMGAQADDLAADCTLAGTTWTAWTRT